MGEEGGWAHCRSSSDGPVSRLYNPEEPGTVTHALEWPDSSRILSRSPARYACSNHAARLSLLHCQMTGRRICRQQTPTIVTQADEPLNPDSL